MRISPATKSRIICACNFSAIPLTDHRTGLPVAGEYRLLVNTDAAQYGGSGVAVASPVVAEAVPWQGLDYSAAITLPPLTTIWLAVPEG
jgi:1,4-alpha-glucan branching enzyme